MAKVPSVTPYGKQIKKALIDKDMTQVELATAIGCEKQYLHKIIHGYRTGTKYRDQINRILHITDPETAA